MKHVLLTAALAVVAAPAAHAAEAWPARPIRFIVPFTPGTLDVVVRLIGQKLTDKYGQPIIVESDGTYGGMRLALPGHFFTGSEHR